MINFIEMNVEFPPHFFHFDETNEIGIYNKNIYVGTYIQVTPLKNNLLSLN